MKDPDVLVIDDDLRFQEFVASVVGRLGLSCTFVRFGEEALRILAKRKFRLVILDGLLPGMRGEEVARKIRSTHTRQDLPILFCSAFYRDLKSFRFLLNDCGVNHILHKPVDEEQLREAVAKLLGLETSASDVEEMDGEERAVLRASYLSTSLDRVTSMKRAVQAMGSVDAPALVSAVQIEAHRFRGSGSSFDLPEVTRIAGMIEDLLSGLGARPKEVPGPVRARLEGLVDALDRGVRQAAGSAPLAPARGPGLRPRILLVDEGDSALAKGISARESEGVTAWLCADPEDALRTAIQRQVDVIFVAADGSGGVEAALESCRSLRTMVQSTLVLLSRDGSVQSRLAAQKAGVQGYASRPADLEGLFRIASLLERYPSSAPVAVAGGSRDVLRDLAEKLVHLGKAAVPCDDSDRLLSVLEETNPSALILDVDGPWEDGFALVRMLRADLRYRGLPILALMEDVDRERITEALASGATACLSKPASILELEPLLFSWVVQSFAREQALAGLDVQTGMMDRGRFERVLDQALGLAKREGQILSVLGIDCGLSEIREAEGRLVTDELVQILANQLQLALRSSDVVARVGSDRFLALLPGARQEDANRVLGERIAGFRAALGSRKDRAVPVGSVVSFPEAPGSGRSLIEGLKKTLDEKRGERGFLVAID